MYHERLTHENCNEQSCNICELFICKVCNCAEGSLPLECPGEPVPEHMQKLIMDKVLDYEDGRWVKRVILNLRTTADKDRHYICLLGKLLGSDKDSVAPEFVFYQVLQLINNYSQQKAEIERLKVEEAKRLPMAEALGLLNDQIELLEAECDRYKKALESIKDIISHQGMSFLPTYVSLIKEIASSALEYSFTGALEKGEK
jgi:hypothetical protein